MSITFKDVEFSGTVTRSRIEKAEQILVDNGIDADEAQTVMQALGYALLDAELYEVARAE